MIIAAMITPLNTNVAIIQYLDFVLILPPDSINASSNIGRLVESYFVLDTTLLQFVPELIPNATKFPFYALALFPAGREATLPRFTRQSWYATNIGAATAIDE